ncbi:transposase domain-containing protein [Pseudomonas sp. ArH3a]|uniref:transposase domain-containing protein n=1 Tax=Pseudomonas sp. ArH3a TaxID=2862945 RepID=UPI001F5A8A1E|nr:transposase domain-containing protein [Pseudomonas sp. ArH3a]UNM17106.1 transposase domain-containing protein [Pseudomonas sp. ArH3a]
MTFGRKKSKSDACVGIGFFYASRSRPGTDSQHRLHSQFNRGTGFFTRPSLVEQALEHARVASAQAALPLEMMLWCVISIAFFRRMSAWDVVNRMNIMLETSGSGESLELVALNVSSAFEEDHRQHAELQPLLHAANIAKGGRRASITKASVKPVED